LRVKATPEGVPRRPDLWFRVAENTFDNFNFSMSAQGR